MSRKPGSTENRREQIIRAAIRVFAKKGFAGASNKDVADEAKITPGLIYHYFKNKEDLLRAAIEGNPTRQLLRSIPPEMLALPTRELLKEVALQFLQVAEDKDFVRLIRVYLPEVIRNPKVAPAGMSTVWRVVETLEQALAEKMQEGSLKEGDPALLSQLFVGCIMDLVLRRQIMKDPKALKYSDEEIVNALVDMTMKGLELR